MLLFKFHLCTFSSRTPNIQQTLCQRKKRCHCPFSCHNFWQNGLKNPSFRFLERFFCQFILNNRPQILYTFPCSFWPWFQNLPTWNKFMPKKSSKHAGFSSQYASFWIIYAGFWNKAYMIGKCFQRESKIEPLRNIFDSRFYIIYYEKAVYS